MKKNNNYIIISISIVLLFLFSSFSLFCQSNALKLNKDKIKFGTLQCNTSKCDTLILKNEDYDNLRIDFSDPILPPFAGKINYPVSIPKNDSIRVPICYFPRKESLDSQRIFIRINTKTLYSIVLLFDVSNSMAQSLYDRRTKFAAAVSAGKNFLDSMFAPGRTTGEAAICEFSTTFNINHGFSTDKNSLINALPKNVQGGTALYAACISAINVLKLAKYKRILIALTDGIDEGNTSYTYQRVISEANANKVTVYTIGIGTTINETALSSIAKSTGGEFFKTQTSTGLEDIYNRIFKIISEDVLQYFDIIGNSECMTAECKGDYIIIPGDTLNYHIYLKGIKNERVYNKKYRLKVSFGSSFLIPLDYLSTYKNDGMLEIKGIDTVDLEKEPLLTLRFFSLLGDSACTKLNIDSLIWEKNEYSPLQTSSNCNICINTCARNLRHIKSMNMLSINDIKHDQKNHTSMISFETGSYGFHQIELYDIVGHKVRTIISGEYSPGKYNKIIDFGVPAGIYFLILRSPFEAVSKKVIIND